MTYKIQSIMHVLSIKGPRNARRFVYVPAYDSAGKRIYLPTAENMVLEELNEKKPGAYKVEDSVTVKFYVPGKFITCKVHK